QIEAGRNAFAENRRGNRWILSASRPRASNHATAFHGGTLENEGRRNRCAFVPAADRALSMAARGCDYHPGYFVSDERTQTSARASSGAGANTDRGLGRCRGLSHAALGI